MGARRLIGVGMENRILIFGNSGSGKTWLASKLAEGLRLPIIHFDAHFWEPGGFSRKRDKQIVFQEIVDLSQDKNWIMEGVFGELADIALKNATAVIFLDKTWIECKAALLNRGSESAKQLEPEKAEEGFKQLLQWAENYWNRSDLRSQSGHQSLFDKAQCQKSVIKSRAEMDEAILVLLRQHYASEV